LTRYLDTSLLVAALTDEASSSRVQAWLSRHAAGQLVISDFRLACRAVPNRTRCHD
jgi:hypothetical protein